MAVKILLQESQEQHVRRETNSRCGGESCQDTHRINVHSFQWVNIFQFFILRDTGCHLIVEILFEQICKSLLVEIVKIYQTSIWNFEWSVCIRKDSRANVRIEGSQFYLAGKWALKYELRFNHLMLLWSVEDFIIYA